MTIFLVGHTYRYAVEQMLFTLFPGEKPQTSEVAKPPTELPQQYICSTLAVENGLFCASAALCHHGQAAQGSAERPVPTSGDPLVFSREAQKAVKLAFYRAALEILPKPRWGALTGVRPVKLAVRVLKQGGDWHAAKANFTAEYDVDEQEAALAATCALYAHQADEALESEGIALYIGIPFCPTRCAYCSFVSASVSKAGHLLAPYLDALHQELTALGQSLARQGAVIRSVYLGGGTPTTLDAAQLGALLAQICAAFDLSACLEFTLEAGRPDTITAEKLRLLADFPVTRISVNPQTMHESTLQAIGRRHTVTQTREAFALVAAHAPQLLVNADLIMGLPGETAEMFRQSLDEVLALAPANITVHSLAIKRSADLTVHSASHETLEKMYAHSLKSLQENGYSPYYLYRQKDMGGSFANIGWTEPGGESLYNLCMMEELCTTAAAGGTGISKIVNRTSGKITRKGNPKFSHEYVARIAHTIEEKEATQWLTT